MNGELLKEAGQQLALFNAGSWVEDALFNLQAFCKARKELGLQSFRFEEFREVAIASGWALPKSHKAWGCLPRLASERGMIAWTGRHAPAESAKTHAHYVKVWEAL